MKQARITVNGSCAMVTSTSELSERRMPWSSASWIGGMPWPIAISIGTASETWPPVSLSSRQASLLRCVQWMYSSPGRSSLALRELQQRLLGRVADAVRHHAHAVLAGELELLRH